MVGTKRLVCGAALSAIAYILASGVQAQDITSGISGKITDAAGKPLSGVDVSITYAPTHTTLKTRTGADGFYNARQLQPGGPYDVVASEDGFAPKTIEVGALPVGDAYELNINLADAGSAVGEVVVTASRSAANTVQTGPRSTFTQADIQAEPSFSRDIKDTARLNPFVTIDPTSSNALLIAGNNNHVNTIYVDGVRQNDIFGLNGNGYPTQRSPFALEDVKAFNVEVAPYDVQYGDFQGGVLNIVTQNGTNDFHGGSYYQYDSSNLGSGNTVGRSGLRNPSCTNGAFTGSNAGGVSCGGRYVNPNYKDKQYGFNLSGPVIPDRLFFFFDYDKYESANIAGYVPTGVPGSNPVVGVTPGDVSAITSAIKSAYGYDPGGAGGVNPVQNTDYFGRIDANITNNQHLFITYQKTDGTTLNTPDESVTKTLGLSSTFYTYEQVLQAETVDLQSHWTSNFSSELEFVHNTVDSPSTISTKPFAFFQVILPGASSVTSTGTSVDAGVDISRQANNLAVSENLFKAKASYTLGANVLTAGYEYDNVKESDLFVQNATGNYVFSNACGAGKGMANGAVMNLAAGQACSFTYANAYDNNPATAGGSATFNTHTVYLQDEWTPFAGLRLRAGARVDYFQAPDKPLYNPTFAKEYGFANNLTIDGEYVIQPRLGFNWKIDPTLSIYGGAGLFSGGTPGVYLYDSYDNPGNLIGTINASCTTRTGCSPLLSNVKGSSIPAAAQAAVTANANAGLGITNSLDPNFHPAADWKASLGLIKQFDLGRFGGDGWNFHLDYLYQKTQYAVNWVDLFEQHNVIGAAPDGRPVFDPARYTAARTTGYDIQLTNTDKGFGHVVAVGLGKTFPFGLSVDYTFTYQHVEDVSPATSSVALSNYSQNATFNPNNPSLAVSNYEIPWESKLSVSFQHKFFGDNRTIATLFMQYRAGLPFSYTYFSSATSGTPADNLFGQTGAAAYRSDQLMYVPKTDSTGNVTATSDPIIKYGSTFNVAQFNTFLKQSGLIKYAGAVAPRNAFNSAPVASADLHLEQEFPAFFPKAGKLSAYLNIINLPNLLDKNWGVIYQTGFPYFQSPVAAKNCQAALAKLNSCATGTGNFYEYDSLRPVTQTLQNSTTPATPTYAVQVGVRFKF